VDASKREWISKAREYLKLFQNPQWGGTDPRTYDGHVNAFADTLKITRESFALADETVLHGVFIGDEEEGIGEVICLTGNSPKSGDRAKALVGFLNVLPLLLDEFERMYARIDDLIAGNNEKLMALREAKSNIDILQRTERWLMDQITREAIDIEQTLGKALGYPVDADGNVDVGDNVPLLLAKEAAEAISSRRAA
jgi:hypothetical protein